MFCPFCGSEDKQSSQFCRKCGGDLRPTLNAIRSADPQQSSAVDELYRAVADKIREAPSAAELAIISDRVIPKLERLVESPEKKRDRQVLAGITGLFAGLGLVLFFVARQYFFPNLHPGLENVLLAAAFVGSMIGLGHLIHALLFSSLTGRVSGSTQRLDAEALKALVEDKKALPVSDGSHASITEGTTRELEAEDSRRTITR